MKKITTIVGLVLLIVSVSSVAGSELLTLIKMLHQNGTVDDAQYERLLAEIEVNSLIKQKQQDELSEKLAEVNQVKVEVDQGGLRVKSSDDEFALNLGGRVQVDSAWYDEDGTEQGNGTKIRRARIYLQGKMFHDWGYKIQYDFTASGTKGIKDAFLTYNGFDHVAIKVGNFKDPLMLQDQTSSKYTSLIERALPEAFTAGRHIGVMATTKHKHWTMAAGFFGDKVAVADAGADEGWGLAARATFAPINEKRRILHLGVASNYRKTGDDKSVRFKQQAETHVSGINIVDTGSITDVESTLISGAELAIVEGSFAIQAEYLWTLVERDFAAELDFDGWFVQSSYFLTGESRRYKKGAFGGIKPASIVGRDGIGAWQLAARYSSIDLNDNEVAGGQADSVAIGLNWFPTNTLRFSANYVTILDVDNGPTHDEEPRLFQVRGQWAF